MLKQERLGKHFYLLKGNRYLFDMYLKLKYMFTVQPTSISRRRLEVTRGSKRLAVDRPPSNEKVKKK